MTGGQTRDPAPGDKVEVLCWCGRVKMYATISDIRRGIRQYCGVSCSTLPPLSKEDEGKPRGRPRKQYKQVSPDHDQFGNRIKPRVDI